MKYYIQTFGCAQNTADSERISADYTARDYSEAQNIHEADEVIINTCMIRQMAEDRVYGLVHNLSVERKKGKNIKIIVTGCMVGMALRDKTGKLLSVLRKRMPEVDEFLPIEEVGFNHTPVRSSSTHALIPITNGCNNFCTYCVVPFSRGREVSRPFEEIIHEVRMLAARGYSSITLLGQNVNSYGADLILIKENTQSLRDIPGKRYFRKEKNPNKRTKEENIEVAGKTVRPTYVTHLGRMRIPTLFPALLAEVAKTEGITSIDFLSSNPWDFSDDLIDVIAQYSNISRLIHLPVQSGDNEILRKMNRWYTREAYIALADKLKNIIPGITLSTDIIVGFCGETREQFQNTVNLAAAVGFSKAYVAMYSVRPMTTASKIFMDDVPHEEKKRRWGILERMINARHYERKEQRGKRIQT